MSDWREDSLTPPRITPAGWLRVAVKGTALVVVAYTGLLLHMLLRLVERLIHGAGRPWTPYMAQWVCRAELWVIGIRYLSRGRPMVEKGAVVANHASWLDIFTLNAGQRIFFVSKAEVAKWPLIGWLARAAGTVFIARKSTEAKRQQEVFETRLRMGHKLLFFPEGTSTDAVRVLPFKSTLFQAFYTAGLDRVLFIQPVTVIYRAPEGEDPRFYGWWGDMEFFPHMLMMLAAPKHGSVEVIWHGPVPVDAFPGRKELAQYCENVVRTSHVLAVE